MKFAIGDRVRFLKATGQGKTFIPAGRCGTVTHVIKAGEVLFVTPDGDDVRRDYIHSIESKDVEFESILDKVARELL